MADNRCRRQSTRVRETGVVGEQPVVDECLNILVDTSATPSGIMVGTYQMEAQMENVLTFEWHSHSIARINR